MIGDDGSSIPSADVKVFYFVPRSDGGAGAGEAFLEAKTDDKGQASFPTNGRTLSGFRVEKDRYYPSNRTVTAGGSEFQIRLRRIVSPVPMQAKRIRGRIFQNGSPQYYDVFMGDWLPPHGTGKVPDLKFVSTMVRQSDIIYTQTLQVSFANQGDGLKCLEPDPDRDSRFVGLYEAPESGYRADWVQVRERKAGQLESGNYAADGKRMFVFRVRTILDAKGNVLQANYGKIDGDFMQFTIYLNPTAGDRSIDPDQGRYGRAVADRLCRDARWTHSPDWCTLSWRAADQRGIALNFVTSSHRCCCRTADFANRQARPRLPRCPMIRFTLFALVLAALPSALTAKTEIIGDLPRKAAFPIEETSGVDTRYEVVQAADGSRLRVILTRPSGTVAKLPAIF